MIESGIDTEWRRRFISDTFHTLAQPLTALHCSLELALMKDDAQECRAALAEALAATQRLIAKTTFLRESAYAEDPGDPTAVDIGILLLKVVDELGPVAEARSVRLDARVGLKMEVFADAAKLEQALFLLLNESLNGVQEGSTMEVLGTVAGGEVTMSIRGRNTDGLDAQSLGMQIASKIFHAAGGEVECRMEDGTASSRARLPFRTGNETIGRSGTNFNK